MQSRPLVIPQMEIPSLINMMALVNWHVDRKITVGKVVLCLQMNWLSNLIVQQCNKTKIYQESGSHRSRNCHCTPIFKAQYGTIRHSDPSRAIDALSLIPL
jgi:hypothetical protein